MLGSNVCIPHITKLNGKMGQAIARLVISRPFFPHHMYYDFFVGLEEMIEFVLCVLGKNMYSKGYGMEATAGGGGRRESF